MNSTSVTRIAFIQASWHQDIVGQGRKGFTDKLDTLGINTQVDFIELPGALEIPLKCKQLSQTGRYDYIVAAAFVVDGGIYRHEFVAQAVISGMMNVQLDAGVPILSMVLTPKQYDETPQTKQFYLEHFLVKGAEIADAIAMLIKG